MNESVGYQIKSDKLRDEMEKVLKRTSSYPRSSTFSGFAKEVAATRVAGTTKKPKSPAVKKATAKAAHA